MVEVEQLAELLTRRFNPDAASELDATIGLNWGTAELRFTIHDQALAVLSPSTNSDPECVIYFVNYAVAHALLSGSANPIEAFMRGELRSDGYLLWVFHVLGAFANPLSG